MGPVATSDSLEKIKISCFYGTRNSDAQPGAYQPTDYDISADPWYDKRNRNILLLCLKCLTVIDKFVRRYVTSKEYPYIKSAITPSL